MGYDLHITRRQSWTDTGDDISIEDFERYLKSDPEFSYPSPMGANYAEWKSPETAYESWLCWDEGRIYSKNPEPELVEKMVVVAKALRAKVEGDDGEIYESATKIDQSGGSVAAIAVPSASFGAPFRWEALPLWKRLVLTIVALGLFQLLRLIVFK